MSYTHIRLTGLTGSATKNLLKDFPYDAFPDAARRCRLMGVVTPGANEQGPSPSATVPRLLERLGLFMDDPGDDRGIGLQPDSWGTSRGRGVPTKVIRAIET